MSATETAFKEALKYADRNFPESPMAPENEIYADIAIETYLNAIRTTPWRIVQRRNNDHTVESVIAGFQHEELAVQFIRAITPITGYYLKLENVDA